MTFHPGCNEIEWLSDLKTVAECIGREELGARVRWRVETRISGRRQRSDVVVEKDDGTLLFSGEAKRPDDPKGAHALIDSEVVDAISKAQRHGISLCFTTNFHELALLSAQPGLVTDVVARLQGNLIPLVDARHAVASNWWTRMTTAERESAVELGLRKLFARYRVSTGGATPPVSVDETVLSFLHGLTRALVDPLHGKFISQRESLTEAIQQRALTAGLDPGNDQDCRYLVAQGIFEVISAALFYQVTRDYFSLEGLLRGTSPQKGKTLADVVKRSLTNGIHESGDYESIFSLSPIAAWVMEASPAHTTPTWRALFGFIERVDVTDISSDVLGVIFERLISPHRRHEMGQHYTPPRIARAMARWGVRSAETIALDPACGAGTFLVETYRRHRELGQSHEGALRRNFGNDIDPFAVHLASVNLATREIFRGANYPAVRMGDAFDLAPGRPVLTVKPAGGEPVTLTLATLDLVITNPPYARSHSNATEASRTLHELFGNKTRLPDLGGANLAAWFVALGTALVAEDGHMAFVLPVAVLQNENLGEWRAWVRRRWDVVIWYTEHDIWFSDARVACCVALFTRRPEGRSGTLQFVTVNERVEGELVETDSVPAPASNSTVQDLSVLAPDEDILIAGTTPASLLQFAGLSGTTTVGDLGDAEAFAGEKLGHAFFKLKDARPDHRGVVRTVTGGISYTFSVSRNHLTPLLDSPKALVNGEPEIAGTWLLTTSAGPIRSKELRNYVKLAEKTGVSRQPSVAARGEHWWARTARVCSIAVPMSSQFQHQLAWLDPPGVVNNNFNAIHVVDREQAELVAASLASAFGALSRLYISGEIGCEGARRVLLTQLVRWPVLDLTRVRPEHATAVLDAYSSSRQDPFGELDELADDVTERWLTLTAAVARAAGASDSKDLARAAVRDAQATVRRRRAREAMALSGRTRGRRSGGASLSTRVRRWCGASAPFGRAVELLTAGPSVVSLRSTGQMAQTSLLGDESYLAADPERERSLSDLLRPGLRCAPPDPIADQGSLDELLRLLVALPDEVATAVLGDVPSGDDAARSTWDELAGRVRGFLLRHLESEVLHALS